MNVVIFRVILVQSYHSCYCIEDFRHCRRLLMIIVGSWRENKWNRSRQCSLIFLIDQSQISTFDFGCAKKGNFWWKQAWTKKRKEKDAKDTLLGIAYPKKGLEDTVPFPRLRICFYETDWTVLIKSHQWAVTKTWYRRITEVMYRSDVLTFLHLFEWCCHTRRQYHWIQVPTAVTKTLVICCTYRLCYPVI